MPSKAHASQLQHKKVIPMGEGSKTITGEDLSPTSLPDAFLESDVVKSASSFKLPTFDELPSMPLYRDQVVAYIEDLLQPLNSCCEGSWITPSMVNNYVKLRIVDAPQKRQYAREQVGRILLICMFKQFLSIAAIERLFTIQRMTYPVDVAYNYCVNELNNAVQNTFSGAAIPQPDTAQSITRETLLVRSAALAFASKAYLMTYLDFLGYETATK